MGSAASSVSKAEKAGPRGHREPASKGVGHLERSRSQLLTTYFSSLPNRVKRLLEGLIHLRGSENMQSLAVNVLAVKFWLLIVPSPVPLYIVSKRVVYTLPTSSQKVSNIHAYIHIHVYILCSGAGLPALTAAFLCFYFFLLLGIRTRIAE